MKFALWINSKAEKAFEFRHLTISVVIDFDANARNSFVIFIFFLDENVVGLFVVFFQLDVGAVDIRHIVIATLRFRVGFFKRYDFRRCLIFLFLFLHRLFLSLCRFRST